MDGLKIIKTEEAYEEALHELDKLMAMDPVPGSEESDRLDVVALLIKTYEDEHYQIDLPDPVAAIKFRMEQQGLKNQDLVQFFGSKSRVSEILNGKRELTLKQARALHHGLGIPAEVMLQEFSPELAVENEELDWDRFQIAEMVKRGWLPFDGLARQAKEHAEELLRPFLEEVQLSCVFCRRGQGGEKDPYGLLAYRAGVYHKVANIKLKRKYDREDLTDEVVIGLGKLSALDGGPAMVADYLSNYGIHFVAVKHFDRTHLDGASMMLPDGTPIIALSLRHDRLDNFWFTLMHELMHVMYHLEPGADPFYDDLDAVVDLDPCEQEANDNAAEALFPQCEFEAFAGKCSALQIKAAAFAHGISPAIIAGRIQKVRGNYKVFHQLVGRGEVRKHFPDYDR